MNSKPKNQKTLKGLFAALFFIIISATLPVDLHAAGPYGMVITGHFTAVDNTKDCFADRLSHLMNEDAVFKKIVCQHPENAANPECVDLAKDIFTELFTARDQIIDQADEHVCSSRSEIFKVLTKDLLANVLKPESTPNEHLKPQDQDYVLEITTQSFGKCSQLFDCPLRPVLDPIAPTVSGIPAPGSQSTDQPSTAPTPAAPVTNDAPVATANNADQPSGGGCSIGVMEAPTMGSLNYALFLALAGLARSIKWARKYLKK